MSHTQAGAYRPYNEFQELNQRSGDSGIDPASPEIETFVSDVEEFKMPYGQ